MPQTIGVGFVGANAARGWALVSHLPALRDNPAYRIAAVATRSAESAAAAAEAFGAPRGYADIDALVTDDAVDLVVVTVKTPDHRAAVIAALAAGKMAFCEWPLGRDLAEAQTMAEAAAAAGVRTMIGLQTRAAPAIRRLRDMVADGWFGTILSTAMTGSALAFDGVVERANDYILDPASGATLLSIPAGHAVDALCFVLGEFESVCATTAVRHRVYRRVEDGALLPNATPDQLAFSGLLASGALASVTYRGGESIGDDFVWEINGSEGDAILSIARGRLSSPGLRVQVAKRGQAPADLAPAAPTLEGGSFAVDGGTGHLYRQFADGLGKGTSAAPDFADALIRHRLLDAIARAAATGVAQRIEA